MRVSVFSVDALRKLLTPCGASSIYADAMDDMALRHWNSAPYVPDAPFAHRRAAHPEARGAVAWAADVDWLGRKVTVVHCEGEKPQPYKGTLVTSLRLDAAMVHERPPRVRNSLR